MPTILPHHTVHPRPKRRVQMRSICGSSSPSLPIIISRAAHFNTLKGTREGIEEGSERKRGTGAEPSSFLPHEGRRPPSKKKAVEMRGPAALIFVPAPLKEKRAGAASSSSPQKWILPQGSVFFLGVAAAFFLLLPPLSFHFGTFRTRHAQSFFPSLS